MFKIDIEKLTALCEEKSICFVYLSQVTGVHIKTLERIKKTEFAKKGDLKAICSTLDIKPRELIVATPMTIF